MEGSTYDFKNRRGLAVIIVNENFTGMQVRQGARKDLEMTTKTFASLGFTVRTYFDLTGQEMKECMKAASKDNHIKEVDCFVCVISSHGDPDLEQANHQRVWTDWIWGTDEPVKIDTLLEPVTVEKCPDLAKKPKLFFIQACRGGRVSCIVEVKPGEQEAKAPIINPMWASEVIIQNIPIQKDFLLAWAVQPGFLSFHRPSGSWFIKGLCKILDAYVSKCDELIKRHKTEKMDKPLEVFMEENLRKCDLMTLMTKVNRLIAEGKRFVSNVPEDDYLHCKKTMPWVAHQLVKDVYLHKLLK